MTDLRHLFSSTRRVHEFVRRLHPNDRILLLDDTRAHESVEVGRISARMQEGGREQD